jgi:2-oxoglutarate ferredoxin oxidoreductase subunit alpha
MPKPVKVTEAGAKVGVIAFGSTDLAMQEARDGLKAKGIKTNYLRLRALPINDDVKKFFEENDRVYVVEQNRDGQVFHILNQEIGTLVSKSKSVRHYDGLPIDAVSIIDGIASQERI